jgi:adenine-specific DNA-methyltransferase
MDFKGKQYIYSHHLSVPFRELKIDAAKSLTLPGTESLDDNLIIQGDNLHALKALLPRYANKVKCIYIDPPYNTGNEGWCYNDNLSNPLMKEWLKKSANPVDQEDMERHDKWLCMMWPRLSLLKELLSPSGVIFISIGDDEVHRLRSMLDELYGTNCFVGCFVWKRRASSAMADYLVSTDHEYVLCYAKNQFDSFKGNDKDFSSYSNPDNDPRGDWVKGDLTVGMTNLERPNQYYDLIDEKTGNRFSPNPNRVWAYIPSSMKKLIENDEVFFPQTTDNRPMKKRFKGEMKVLTNPLSTWISSKSEDFYDGDHVRLITGMNTEGTTALQEIFGAKVFNYSKPKSLIQELIKNSTNKDDIVLDSFSGSGTTGHAVQALNMEDAGNRKFILIECEDYADTITAERMRRVIMGVPSSKDGFLQTGLGGSFTFCELGEAFDIDRILTGEHLPNYNGLAQYVFYTATGESLSREVKEKPDHFVGETDLFEIYLIYKDDLSYLRSNESALNQEKLDTIVKRKSTKQKVVFATAKYMSQSELTDNKITFCQIPYAIHKIAGN